MSLRILMLYFFFCFPAQGKATTISLSAFIDEVLSANPTIQAANANVAAADMRHMASSQPLYNPELVLESEKTKDKQYSIGLTQTIDWTHKKGARTKVGKANYELAKANRALLYQKLSAEILTALSTYHSLQQVLVLAKAKKSLLSQFVEITKKRHANGDVAGMDVDLAQVSLSESFAQIAYYEEDLNRSLQMLQGITGSNQRNWPQFPDKLPHLDFDQSGIDKLIQHLPSITILNNTYISAKERINLAKKEQFSDPTISFRLGKERTDGSNSVLVGLGVSLPLHIRNSYRAESEAAKYDAIEAEKKRLDMIRQTRAEIYSTHDSYQKLHKSLDQWQSNSSKNLKQGIELLEKLWRSRDINTMDYLIQIKQRIDNQITGAELKGRSWYAWINWLKATGMIDDWLYNKNERRKK